MTLQDIIDKLRFPQTIEIRDEDNMFICTTRTDSAGIKPYVNMKVFEWFVYSASGIDFVVSLEGIRGETE